MPIGKNEPKISTMLAINLEPDARDVENENCKPLILQLRHCLRQTGKSLPPIKERDRSRRQQN